MSERIDSGASKSVNDSAGYPIGEGEDVLDETLIDGRGGLPLREPATGGQRALGADGIGSGVH